MARLNDQIKDKQDQVDQLEHRLFSISDEHTQQTNEMEGTIRSLQKRLNKMEVDHIEATQEFEKTQEELIMKDE